MPRRRCCCCIYETDRFDREDNTNIGANWSEVLGDWEIKDEELYTEYSDALARNLVPHPDNEFNIRVTVEVKGVAEGDQLRVMGPWWDEFEGYLFAELELDSVCGIFSIYSHVDGVTTLLRQSPVGPAPPDEWHEIEIALCMHSYPYLPRVVAQVETGSRQTLHARQILRLYASFDIESAVLLVPIDAAGITGGVGTGLNTQAAYFDNFTVAQTKGTDENDQVCPDCATSAASCVIFEDDFERYNVPDIAQVLTNSGDDWSVHASFSLTTTGTTIVLGKDGLDNPEQAGWHFSNVTIPQGSPIVSAKLYLTVDTPPNGTVNFKFYGEAQDNAAAHNDLGDWLGMSFTSASSVTQNIGSEWTDANVEYSTVELAAIIQEIVGRAGWASGNGLNLVALLQGGVATGKQLSVFAADFIEIGINHPRLEIYYTHSVETDVLGCLWEVISGEWQVVAISPPSFSAKWLSCVSAGRIICKVPAPIEDGITVSALLGGPLGTSCRILGDYIDDNNYIYGEVTFDTVFPYTNGQIRLVRVDGGVETELGIDAGLYVAGTYTLCLDGGIALFGLSSTQFEPIVEADYTVRGGLLTGIDADDGWVVDDYLIMRARSLPFAPNCPTCFPPGPCVNHCDQDHPAPDEISVDLTAMQVTDGACSYCDQIPAIFILRADRTNPCCYTYRKQQPCDLPLGTCAEVITNFVIGACVSDSGAGRGWTIVIRLTALCRRPFESDDIIFDKVLTFQTSDDGTNAECDTFPRIVAAFTEEDTFWRTIPFFPTFKMCNTPAALTFFDIIIDQ